MSSIDHNRRHLLKALAAAGLMPGMTIGANTPRPSLLVSAYYHVHAGKLDNRLCWTDPATGELRTINTGFRGHGLYPHPVKPSRLVLFARRPGRRLIEIDLRNANVVRQVEAGRNRHFYGHGVFTGDGRYLYTTENDFERGRGMIVVRDGDTLAVVNEFPSEGIGPHDIRMLSDDQTLVIANGGILTHPDRPRRKLNLDDMQPNLAYLDRQSGQLLEQHHLSDHQLSIRHLAVTQDDQVIAVQQYEGSRKRLPPLVMLHRPGQAIRTALADDATQRRMDWYTASVAADSHTSTALVTSPRGNLVTLWDIDRDRLIRSFDIRKPYGAALAPNSSHYAISCADGALYSMAMDGSKLHMLKTPGDGAWDNHMIWTDLT